MVRHDEMEHPLVSPRLWQQSNNEAAGEAPRTAQHTRGVKKMRPIMYHDSNVRLLAHVDVDANGASSKYRCK